MNGHNTELSEGGSSLRPIQEGSSLLIRGLPSGPKPYEEVLTFLRKGSMLQKYGRHGNPKYHHFRLAADDKELQWESKGIELKQKAKYLNNKQSSQQPDVQILQRVVCCVEGRIRRVPLHWMKRFQRGQETDVFKRYPQPSRAFQSFSILYKHEDTGKERSLDVVCPSHGDFEVWYWGIQVVRTYPPAQFSALLGPRPAPDMTRAHTRQVTFNNSMDLSRSLETATTQSSSSKTFKSASMNQSQSTMVLAPTMRTQYSNQVANSTELGRNIGDLYVWGSMAMFDDNDLTALQSPNMPCTTINPLSGWQQGRSPMLVHNTGGLNVVQAACGTRHAALISRAGELYTWGYGRGGALGHGSLLSLVAPQRVEGRWVQAHEGVQSATASDACTAAITSEGKLYTWGDGLAGQLGHGSDVLSVSHPKLVRSLSDAGLRVAQVSCGPYHTGAVTLNGLLFTWGCGLFGRLGHGNQASTHTPRLVSALQSYMVTYVSCGWWHTAAVATSRHAMNRRMSVPITSQGLLLGVGKTENGSMNTNDMGPGSAMDLTMSPPKKQSSSGVAVDNDVETSQETAIDTVHDSAGLVNSSMSSCDTITRKLGESHTLPVGRMRVSDTNEQFMDTAAGGMLFTWGGDFTWMEPSDVRPYKTASLGPLAAGALDGNGSPADTLKVPNQDHDDDRPSVDRSSVFTILSSGTKTGLEVLNSSKRDNHRGCLGTGDLMGRLLPTRVLGDLERRDVVQVACGWNVTVALSRDGHVFQMGSTGAYNPDEEKGGRCPPWEKCKVPIQVDGNLFGLYIEEVAVGMHHVAAVASRLQANGRLAPETRRCRLLTWGQGRAGQLGMGGIKDHNLPQVVQAIDGRRILHVACGGHHTLAVCEHDHYNTLTVKKARRNSNNQNYPSPPNSLLNGLSGLGTQPNLTPRVPSSQSLTAPRISYPPPRATPNAMTAHAPIRASHPLSQSASSGLASIAAAIVTATPTPTNVTATVSSWLGNLKDSVGLSHGSGNHKSNSSSQHGVNNSNNFMDGRSSADDKRKLRISQSGVFKVVQLPSLMRRAIAHRASDGVADHELRRARTGKPPAPTSVSTGSLAPAERAGSAGLPLGRRGLTSHVSSSALSTQSSPGLMGQEEVSDRLSPSSSLCGYDGTGDERSRRTMPRAASDIGDVSAGDYPPSPQLINRRPGEDMNDRTGQPRYMLQRPGDVGVMPEMSVGETASSFTSLNMTPLPSPPVLDVRSGMYFPTNSLQAPTPHMNASSHGGVHWAEPVSISQQADHPDVSQGHHEAHDMQGHDSPRSPSAFASLQNAAMLLAQGVPRDPSLSTWQRNQPNMHSSRYDRDADLDDLHSPPSNAVSLTTPHHSLVGMPLTLIQEQPSGELHMNTTDATFEIPLQTPLQSTNALQSGLVPDSAGLALPSMAHDDALQARPHSMVHLPALSIPEVPVPSLPSARQPSTSRPMEFGLPSSRQGTSNSWGAGQSGHVGDPASDLALQNAALQRQVAELTQQLDAARQLPGASGPSASLQSASVRQRYAFTRSNSRSNNSFSQPASAQHHLHVTTPNATSPLQRDSRLYSQPSPAPNAGDDHPWTTAPSLTHARSFREGSAPSIISIGSRRMNASGHDLEPGTPDVSHGPRTVGGVPVAAVLESVNSLRNRHSESFLPPVLEPPGSVAEEESVDGGSELDDEVDDVADDAIAPIVQVQHPFASAVTPSPGGPTESASSAKSSIADVVQSVGPGMLNTKAGSILMANRKHRRCRSMDTRSLSLAVSPTNSHTSGWGGYANFSVRGGGTTPLTPAGSHGAGSITSPTFVNRGNSTAASSLSGTAVFEQQTTTMQPSNGPSPQTTQPPHPAALTKQAQQAFYAQPNLPVIRTQSLMSYHSVPYAHGANLRDASEHPTHPVRQSQQLDVLPEADMDPDVDHTDTPTRSMQNESQRTGNAASGLQHIEASNQLLEGTAMHSGNGQVATNMYVPASSKPTNLNTDAPIQSHPIPDTAAGRWMEEIVPGVYIFLRHNAVSGQPEVYKIRFSRRLYTPEQANLWWNTNQSTIAARYTLSMQFGQGPGSQDVCLGRGSQSSAGFTSTAHSRQPSHGTVDAHVQPGNPATGSVGGTHLRNRSSVEGSGLVSPAVSLPMNAAGLQLTISGRGSGNVTGTSSPMLPGSHVGTPTASLQTRAAHMHSMVANSGNASMPQGLPPTGLPSALSHLHHLQADVGALRVASQPGSPLTQTGSGFSQGLGNRRPPLASSVTEPGHHQSLEQNNSGLIQLPEDVAASLQQAWQQGYAGSLSIPKPTVSIQSRARPGHHRSRSGGPSVGGRTLS